MGERIVGIYGGTFNPPHLGHVRAAEAFARAIEFDELLIIPDFMPPHKQYDAVVSEADRLKMCELAFGHIPKTKIDDLEIKRGGKSYTAVTLTELTRENQTLYFLCGTDMFVTLDRWYDFRTIFRLATICCIRRETDTESLLLINKKAEEYREKYGAKIIHIEAEVVELSSSEVRGAIISSENIETSLTPEVYEYIKSRGLYR